MKKGFTLIEVLISVFIFFIFVFSVFNITDNNKKLFSILEDRNNFYLKSSIWIGENSLYGINIINEFNITNSEIIRLLKNEKVYKKEILDLNEEYNYSNISVNYFIKKLKFYDKHHSIILYSIGIK